MIDHVEPCCWGVEVVDVVEGAGTLIWCCQCLRAIVVHQAFQGTWWRQDKGRKINWLECYSPFVRVSTCSCLCYVVPFDCLYGICVYDGDYTQWQIDLYLATEPWLANKCKWNMECFLSYGIQWPPFLPGRRTLKRPLFCITFCPERNDVCFVEETFSVFDRGSVLHQITYASLDIQLHLLSYPASQPSAASQEVQLDV